MLLWQAGGMGSPFGSPFRGYLRVQISDAIVSASVASWKDNYPRSGIGVPAGNLLSRVRSGGEA